MYHVAACKGNAQDDNGGDNQHCKDEPEEALVRRRLFVPACPTSHCNTKKSKELC